MRSDLAIASADAAFALDEVKLGIPPMFVMAAIVDHMLPSPRTTQIAIPPNADRLSLSPARRVSWLDVDRRTATTVSRLHADRGSRALHLSQGAAHYGLVFLLRMRDCRSSCRRPACVPAARCFSLA
jgi:hypothetical protein